MWECADDWARVTFPVAPKWVHFFPIVMGFATGLIELASAILVISMFSHTSFMGGPGDPRGTVAFKHFRMVVLAPAGIYLLLGWGSAGCLLWTYLRWGRVPRVLVASAEVLTLTRLRWWRIRQRRWPADEIGGVELRRVKSLIGKRTVADLFILRPRGWRLRFRLSSLDPHSPRQIAEAVAQKLNRPLTS
jgi:hypothetical protein